VTLRGHFRILFLYDVAEAFDTDKLRQLISPRGTDVKPTFLRGTPDYVRFEQAPIVEPSEAISLPEGGEICCSVKYYSYAVAVVELQTPFQCEWDALIQQSAQWINRTDVEPLVRKHLQHHLDRIAAAMIKPTAVWSEEDYLIIEVNRIEANGTQQESTASFHDGAGLMTEHGEQIVRVLRGEFRALAPKAVEEALQSSLSYYASDLVVIGASAAFIYDQPEDVRSTIQVIEYAKMQLLEFRYYDNLMTDALSSVYGILERKRNALLSRWTLPRDARRVNTIRLDVMELTERIDNAIKFVSDIFYARVYRLAATRIGVPDYRMLVEDKLRTLGELYDSIVDRFNEERTFVIEVAVTILALLDVILLFKGK
jgi:hypothetical protein